MYTHRDHVSEQARVSGSRLILSRLRDLQADGSVAIVTADFNARPRSPTHRLYTDAGFTDAYLAAGHADHPERSFTYHGWRGREFRREGAEPVRIDWILVRDGARWRARVTSCEIVRDAAPPVYPSDHYPVVADLLIEPVDDSPIG
ncbi:MAG: endonuclease/exonuclease/phosphatase family protein [Chloroflexi bacterium]|nr:endonuclease/exonuclease/phosphatase family protein [Chloroflexota bacterium]